MGQTFLKRVVILACALFALTRVEPAFANPVGGVVAAGSATITATNPSTLHIAQHTDRAVIDWRGFDIAPSETTQFVQPNANSIALNRVNSTSASQIDGKLTANGNVVIVNQNGVVFGSGARVDANSLVVSTADTDNNTFMAGGPLTLNKASTNPNAAIINHGTITAKEAGLVGLVAPDVENHGIIAARLGRAQLASGDTATVDLYGDGLLEVAVSDRVTKQLVKNTGTISADGGIIALTAADGRNIINSNIHAGGTMVAQTVSTRQGAIIIASATSAQRNRQVIVTAKLDVSGKNAGEKGGAVHVMGDKIALMNGAKVDASGVAGGGEILIGGDYHGGAYRGNLTTPASAAAWGNTPGGYSAINGTNVGSFLANLYPNGQVPTASRVFVDSQVSLLANATSAGNGGRVIIWSDHGTVFNGFADTGAYGASGNGGFIETSGEDYLQLAGSVNARAAHGVSGTWLLDPADITISNAVDSIITAASPFQSTGGATSNLNVATLVAALNGGANVIISSAAGTGGLGNITFADAVSWNSIRSLTVNASNNITVNAAITNAGTGDINLNANVAAAGSIAINSALSTGGNINLLANRDITVGANLTGNGLSLMAANGVTGGTGRLNLSGNLILGSGNLTLISGINGTRPSWTMDATTLSHAGSFSGAIDVEGFNALTINRPLALTAGNNLNLTNNTLVNLNNNLSVLGAGTISIGGPVVLPEAAALSITTGGGAVTFASSVSGTAGGVAETLNINSGSGTTTFTGALNGFDPTVTAGTISFGSTLGATTTMGAVVLTAANALTLPDITATSVNITTTGATADITASGNITSTGAVIITAFRDLTLAAARTITAGGTGNLSLKAANGVVAGTGNLTLNGNLNQNGTGGITLYSGINGVRPNWTANTTTLVHAGSFGGAVDIQGFGTLTINRALALTTGNNLTLTNNTATVLNANLSTLGAGTITVNGPVTLPEAAAVSITTGNGAVSFGGTISGTAGGVAETLSVNSGTGTTTFTGALNGFDPTVTAGTISFGSTLGATTTMGAVVLTAANALTLPDITASSVNITTTGATADISVTGNITSAGSVVITAFRDLTLAAAKTIASGTTGNLSLKAANGVTSGTGALTLNGNLSIGTGNLTLYSGTTRPSWTPTATNLVHVGAFNGHVDIQGFNVLTLTRAFDLASGFNLNISNNTSTALGVNLSTLGSGTITVSNPITIVDGSTLSISTANQAIVLGAISGVAGGGTETLTTNSGTANTTFGALNGFVLNASAQGYTFGGAMGGTTTMGAVTIGGVNAFTLPDITAASVNVTSTGATGDITTGSITSAGAVTITAFRDLTVAAAKTVTAGGAGALSLKAANGATGGTGNLVLTGNVGVGTGALTLYSGINGARPSWTASATSLVHAGSFSGAIDIQGFNVLTLSRAIALTANQNLSFANNTSLALGASASLSTLGTGTINITNPTTIAAGAVVSVTTANQPITFGSTVTGGSAASSLTTNSGTATTTFTGNLNQFILNATADTITFGGTLGQTTTMAATTLNSAQAIVLPAITAASLSVTTTGGTADITANGIIATSGATTLNSARDITTNANNTSTGATTMTAARDILVSGNITSSAAAILTAARDLTVAATKTVTAGGTGALTLRAANGVVGGTGNLTLNGNVGVGTGAVTLISGINGTRPSWTANATTLVRAGSFGGTVNIEGFDTLTINRPIVLTAGNILIANNTSMLINSNLTTAGTGTITISNPLVLQEAAAVVFTTANQAINLNTVNGTAGGATESLTLTGGTGTTTLGGAMNGITLAATASNFVLSSTFGATTPMVNVTFTSAGALTLPDVTLSGNFTATTSTAATGNITVNGNILSSGGNISITSVRDLTLAATKTVASGPAGSFLMAAANNVVTGTGALTLNGNISGGTGALTLLSGINGTRPAWTANTTTLVQQGASFGNTSITGFGTITLNRDLTSSGNITVTSYGDLTLNAANTITNGAAGTLTLNAGGGVIGGTGNLNLNGIVNAGSGAVTLLSGINGTRPSYTMGTGNFTPQSTFGAITISGYQDFIINRNLTSSGNISIIAQHDLTLNSTMNVQPGSTSTLTLQAANGAIGTTGNLNLNGILRPGTGAVVLTSGNPALRSDYTITPATNWIPQSTSGPITITGFRDMVIAGNLSSNGTISIIAQRDLTLNPTFTITTGSAGALTLQAANATVGSTGNLTLNGNLSVGTGGLTLTSGVNGTRPSITFGTTNLVPQSTFGAISITGFLDLIINRSLTSNGNINIVAQHDLTLNSTMSVQPGSASTLTLQAANGAIGTTGNLNLNGILRPGTGAVSLVSGNPALRSDYTISSANWIPQSTSGPISITGMRDVVLNGNLSSNGNITIIAQRDLTQNSTFTITPGSAGALSLQAAGGTTPGGTGNLTLNGNINAGSGALTLYSGINGTRPSYTMTTTNFTQQGGTIGAVDIQGFQDFTLNQNMTSSGAVNIISQRDLNISASRTLTNGATSSLFLAAANNNINGTGNLNINGNLSVGTGAFTLHSGINGTRPSYSPNATTLIMQGATFGTIDWQGFATLTIGRPIVSSGTINFGNAVNVLENDVTSTGAITFPNATVIAEGKTINITSTNANITFSNTLDGTAGGVGENVIINAGTGTVLFSAAVGNTVPLGNVSITANNLTLTSTLAGTGVLTLAPSTAGRAVNIGTATTDADTTAGFNLTTAEMGRLVNGWSQIVIGSLTSGDVTNNYATYNDRVRFLSGNDFINAVATSSGDEILIQAVRDVIVNQNLVTTSTTANAITLVAGRNFLNNKGSGSLTTGAGGRWLVYSTNPTGSTGEETLSNAFNRYTCTYGGSCPALGTGNGLLYSYTPLLDVTISGQTYNFGDVVIVPTGYTLQTTGYLNPLDSGSDIIGGTGIFQTSYVQGQNAGTGYTISNNGSTFVSSTGYGFNFISDTSGIVGTRAITVRAADQARIYGFGALGTTGFTITSGSLYNTDVIDGVVLTTNASTSSSGEYRISGGTPWTIDASGATFSSGLGSNYAITYAGAPVGLTITPRALSVSATGINKVYNGNGIATVTLGDDRVSGDLLTIAYGTASFPDKNAGTGRTVNVSGITVTGTDANNYTFNTTTTTTADITKAALTITVDAANKIYNGLTTASITYGDDRISGDVFTISNTASDFTDKNVGTGKTVNVSGINITGTDANNYTFNTTASDTADITPRALTVTATALDKIYDGLTTASITLGDNRVLGDVLTISNGAESFVNKNAGINKTVNVTGISVTGTDSGNYTFNTSTSTTATITQKALTVTATALDKIYNGLTTASVTLGDDRVLGDVLTISNGAANFTDKNAGTGKTVNVTGISVTGTDSGNYTFNTSTTDTADITQRALTVSATGINKVYDGLADATVTLGDNRVASDVLTIGYTTASFPDKNAGSGLTVNVGGITVTGTDAGNYTFNASTSTTANITKAVLTVTATALDKVYDGLATASVTLGDDRILGDVLTISNGAANFTNKNVGNGKTVNVTGITVTGTDSGNYTFNTSTTDTADITPKALTVTATALDKIYNGLTTASVTLGDDRVLGDVLTISNSAATFVDKNVGNGKTVTVSGISVLGTDAGNYTFNTSTTDTADITPRALTVSATGINKVYDGLADATVTLGDNRVASDVLTLGYTTASFPDKNAGNGRTVNVTGITVTGTDAGNYTFNTSTTTTANITKAALTVTATALDKVYNGLTTASVTLGDDRILGDVLTISNGAANFTNKNVGNGKTVNISGISVTGTDANNYTFNTSATDTADITPRALTVTATGIDKVYNGLATGTVTLGDDRVGGDVLSLGYGSANFGDKNVGNGKTINVGGITVTGTDSGNYTFNTTASTSADITPRALTITATALDKVYDGLADATVTLSDNRIVGDVLTISTISESFADKNAANNKTVTVSGINVTGTDAGNYTFNTSATDTANITKAALTVTATALDKVYNGLTTASVTLGDDRILGDVLTISNGAANFGDKNVGNGKTVNVTGITVTGTDAGNYSFNASTTDTANITPRALTVTANALDKVYNGLATASITLGDDRVAGDVLTLGQSSATFADKNVGNGKTVTVSGITVTGTDSGNYTFNTSTTDAANITPRALTVSAIALDKVYNGLADATFSLSDNRVAGDVLTISNSGGSFADKNAANNKTVTVSGITVTGTDAGNYTFNTSATDTANITKAALTVTATALDKVYNGLTTASVTLGDNRIGGDVLTISNGAANFTNKNAGINKTVNVTGITVTGTDAGNYTFNTSTTATATITQRALTIGATGINKVYNGISAANVTLNDNRVAGDVLSIGYNATFANKNVGTGKTVTVNGITLSGADAGNYTFNTSTSTTANITQRALNVTAVAGNKPFDGNTNATITLGDNRVAGDVLSIGYTSANFDTSAVGFHKPVTVSGITVTGTDSGNYTFNTSALAFANIIDPTATPTGNSVVPSTVQQISQNPISFYAGVRNYTLTYVAPTDSDFQLTRSFYLPLAGTWPEDRPEDNMPPLLMLYEGEAEEI